MITAFDTREEWLAARKTGIGASESPGILEIPGRPSYMPSRLVVYADKRSETPPVEREANELMEAGNALEDGIAHWAGKRAGLESVVVQGLKHWRSEERPWLCATPDATARRNGEKGVVQCKNVAGWNADKWPKPEEGGSPPLWVNCQVQHELAVTGFTWGLVAVCVGGTSLRTYTIERHDGYIDDVLIPELENFWENFVQAGVQPAADASPESKLALDRLFPRGEEPVEVDLPIEYLGVLEEWEEAEAQKKHAIELERAAKIKIEDYLSKVGATIGVFADGRKVTWREQTRSEHVVKASTFTTLRRSKS